VKTVLFPSDPSKAKIFRLLFGRGTVEKRQKTGCTRGIALSKFFVEIS